MSAIRWSCGKPMCLALLVTCACAGGESGMTGPDGDSATPTVISLESDVGDWIGGGGTYRYTQADAAITVSTTEGLLSVSVDGDEGWSGQFQLPSEHERVEPGTFVDLERYPFHDPAKGGMSWTGEGRGCNTLSGRFTIDEVVYESGILETIDLRFQQHCEGGPPALRGTIHWDADDPTVPPGPESPPPAGLWEPPAGSTPASGNYAYLESDPGDYIGQGQTYLYTGEKPALSANQVEIAVTVGGWHGTFLAMNVLEQLEPGYYPDLQRYPFHNPVKGGLSWSGNGRGCNRLRGWFVLDHIAYTEGTITAVDLRFQQRCEEGTPALHGEIHWRR